MNQAQLTIVRQEFEQWWASYPRKIGKLAAEKEYIKARRVASAETLLNGVAKYRQTKPAYADWCHAKTWLSQGRWLDDVEAAPRSDADARYVQSLDRSREVRRKDWWDA